MRITYKNIAVTILTVHAILMWCYIMMSSNGPVRVLPKTSMIRTTTKLPTESNLNSKSYTNGNCADLKLSMGSITNASWSAVDEAKTAFVFSAYTEKQGGQVIVIGASIIPAKRLYCQYWDAASHSIHVHNSNVRMLPEDHGNRYSGAIFECPTTTGDTRYVSVVTEKCEKPLSILIIQNATKPDIYDRKFTVCLKPLHFRYGRSYEMVEWIELNRLIGAEKFIIYNYSIAVNVGDVLNHYIKQGIVEVVQWNLPITSYTWPRSKPVEIHSIGMLPMLQDCLYRNKQHSEFVVNIDVDEFIIPHSDYATTWSEMLAELKVYADTYFLRNTFFRKEWNSSKIQFSGHSVAKKLKLVTLQKFERENKIFPVGSRSKYFTRTSKTNVLMIHQVAGSKSYTVPIEIGLLHHYRNWLNYDDASPRVSDDTVLLKYGTKLLKRVDLVWKELVNVELDIPI